jgi:hypothetical protein
MEGTLFNSGFLGTGGFHWWIGQIAQDSTWKDNILPGKFESPDQIPGWGYRYKVRIIGYHDKEEETIPSDQLPWAQVMYPITAGGGQGTSSQTPNIRQGNFVFGFFLDDSDAQVPVIMGVLGNNAQTVLGKTVGTTQSNFAPTSAYTDQTIKVPDEGKSIGPTPANPEPTLEGVNAVQQQSAADVKRNELYQKKTVLMNPCNMMKSALKAIQIKIQELTDEINKILHAAKSYVDAASQILSDIRALIANFACEIAKYIKIIFDKIMQYVLKKINKALAPTVNKIPPNKRNQFIDIKKTITKLIVCLYNKLTQNLCAQLQGFFEDKTINNKNNPFMLNTTKETPPNTYTFTTLCSVETLTGTMIAMNMKEMTDGVSNAVNIANSFLSDTLSEIDKVGNALSQVSGGISQVSSLISGINGSISSALNFENITFNVFGCDLKPECPISDYYTLQKGGGATTTPNDPRVSEVDKSTQEFIDKPLKLEIPFATPIQNLKKLISKDFT